MESTWISLLDDTDYENSGGRWYLGSFGSAFNDEGWNRAYDWLAKQDADMAYSDKPAFASWWDYVSKLLTVVNIHRIR